MAFHVFKIKNRIETWHLTFDIFFNIKWEERIQEVFFHV